MPPRANRKVVLSPHPPRLLSAGFVILSILFFGVCVGNALAAILESAQ